MVIQTLQRPPNEYSKQFNQVWQIPSEKNGNKVKTTIKIKICLPQKNPKL